LIAYLTGTVQKKLEKAIILNAGAVGYLVHVIPPVIEKISEGANAEFFIHTKVREDDISLYGFETYQELTFFQTVLNVNGIGPKLALEILSHNPIKVKTAILKGDIAALSKIPGIGKKTAERIIVELKSKVDMVDIDLDRTQQPLEEEVNDEAVEALIGLGYQRYEVVKTLKNIPTTVKSTEEIITYFLRNV
jgi:Holliday junction DNA helicase RuvA